MEKLNTESFDKEVISIVNKWERKSPFFNSRINQKKLENIRSHFDKKTRIWDSLPYFNDKQIHLSNIRNDIVRLAKDYSIEPCKITKDDFHALTLHRFKFNSSLINTLDSLTKYYRLNGKELEGNTDAIFGIPGSGKSEFAKIIKTKSSNDVVIMESSDARYHLFARKVIDLEEKYTQYFDQCKAKLESPAITVMLLSILNWSAQTLNRNGYDVIHVNNEFVLNADKIYADKKFFIEHRFVSLSSIEKITTLGQDTRVIQNIFQRGTQTLPKSMHKMWHGIASSQNIPSHNYDSYPWNDAIEITDFEKMNIIFRNCRPSAVGHQLRGLYFRSNKSGVSNPYNKMIKISNSHEDNCDIFQRHLWTQYEDLNKESLTITST